MTWQEMESTLTNKGYSVRWIGIGRRKGKTLTAVRRKCDLRTPQKSEFRKRYPDYRLVGFEVQIGLREFQEFKPASFAWGTLVTKWFSGGPNLDPLKALEEAVFNLGLEKANIL